MKNYEKMTVGQIVADDIENSVVFERYGIDFCCNGSDSLSDACTRADIDMNQVIATLDNHTNQDSEKIDFKRWPLDLLVDYIIKFHHRNIRLQGPQIEKLLNKVCAVHGENHPSLFEVQGLFKEALSVLACHLDKEEIILFPYVYDLYAAEQDGNKPGDFHCGTIDAPISVMMAEHDVEGERFRQISRLTDGYNPPEDACESYKLLLRRLKEFELALHQHIHLENNIVFPQAINLECGLNT